MIDPMLATGGSAVAALDLLQRGRRDATSASSASSRRPKASRPSSSTHPDVAIYTPVVDRGLNDHKYIVPGLGDFGDRLYGTRLDLDEREVSMTQSTHRSSDRAARRSRERRTTAGRRR